MHIDNHWEFRNGYRIDTAINFTKEGVQSPFQIVKGVEVPIGTYDNHEIHTRLNTNLTKPISLIVVSKIGGFFSGNRRNTDTTLRFRFASLRARWHRVLGGLRFLHILQGGQA